MTRPDLRTPRPGELLRAATSKRATPPQSLSATPWQGNATAAGLRALDREMIYLDEKAAQSVAEARAEIAGVAADLLNTQTTFTTVVHGLTTRLSTAEGDITAAETALTDLEDVQLPALRGRLDDAEYDVKHFNAEWITAGTIDTARLNVLDIAAETAQVIDLDVSRLTASAATIDEGVVDKLWSDVVTTRFLTATEKIITEDVIATGAVTAQALNVVSTTGTGYSWRLNNGGLFAMHSESDIAARFDAGGLRMWDESGNLTIRINGVQNYFQGEFRTVLPGGGRGVIIANTGQDQPGVWLTSTGGGGDSVPGMRLSVGATSADDRLVIQGVGAMRYNNWRGGVANSVTTHTGGAERNPGALSWSVNRGAPVTLAGAGLTARESGFYTITFYAHVSSRPGLTTRAFAQIIRAATPEARVPHTGEDRVAVTWMGWANAGDTFTFTQYMDASGSYTLTAKIAVLYHGE